MLQISPLVALNGLGMEIGLWVLGAVLVLFLGLGVAFAVYRWFSDPAFLAKLAAWGVRAAWNLVAPVVAKRKTPEEEAIDHERYRQGLEPLRKGQYGDHSEH